MPVLPHLYRRAASASQDTRILDSRQLRDIALQAAQSLSHTAKQLLERIPHIQPRQSNGIVAIPTVYAGINSGPAPGAVVGIVLGSVCGFLLLIWLFWSLSNGSTFMRSTQDEEVSVVRRRSRSPRSRRSSRRTEMTSRSPARRERVIRQERIVRDINPPRAPSRIRETVIVDDLPLPERRVDGDDIVEVIEEHSSIGGAPPPRRKSRRESGYRSVNPDLFAGGDYPQHAVRR
ncbi:hypothetical protein LTR36_008600 [Oleoguttula mirabilis]|uniref:Uncharacterized protein n=1 Tax=Oleoguttula mirabilis TaxID=1507867 RepID=A0AAV9JV17_9PEZI|nr:hypothetical protein LTR36_008600 [Oleoguttula mirabilis]